MKKFLLVLLGVFLSITILGSGAFALSIDFTDGSIWGGASGNQSYSHYYSELDLDVTLYSYQNIGGLNVVPGGVLTWNPGDGIGIDNGYEYDEIEGSERLFVIFSKGVYLSGIHLTDFFNESGYLEIGGYRLKITPDLGPTSYGPNNPISADPTQLTGQSNGELIFGLGDNLVWGVGFGAPGLLGEFENHEYSLAGLEVNPVPEPATMLLLGTGLIGIAGFGRKKFFKK